MRISILTILFICFFNLPTNAVAKSEGVRSLTLYNTKTERHQEITFWENGDYSKKGMRQISYFMRDWRNEKVRPIDPTLMSLLFDIKEKASAKFPQARDEPIHIISGYRSHETNRVLEWKGRNVARNSMHIRGQAVDFKIPGVPLMELSKIAKSFKAGGVGTYPSDDFIHIDTGSVRHW